MYNVFDQVLLFVVEVQSVVGAQQQVLVLVQCQRFDGVAGKFGYPFYRFCLWAVFKQVSLGAYPDAATGGVFE